MNYYKNKRIFEIKVGLLTLISILILIFGYSWFKDLLSKGKFSIVRVYFENADNIEPGSSVTIYGVKSGKVKKLSLDKKGIIADLYISTEFPLPDDTKFYIIESDLMGNRQIDVIPGQSPQILDPNKIHNGINRYGLAYLVSKMNAMTHDMEVLLEKITNPDGLANNMNTVLKSTQITVTNVNKLMGQNSQDIDATIKNLSHTAAELDKIVTENKPNIKSTIDLSNQTLTKVSGTLDNIDQLTKNINEIAVLAKKDDSTIKLLMNDKQLYMNLLNSSARLDSLLIDIKQNPKKYFNIKVF